jgi:dipeptidyl aminopeptidase/acylaminoacyl peptidase
VDGAVDLYRVASDGQSPPSRLTASLNDEGDVTGFVVGASTSRIVFGFEAPRAPSPSQLYGAGAESQEPWLLDSTTGQILAPYDLVPDGSRVLYRKGVSLDDCDLFSCATDGTSAAIALGDFFAVQSFQLAPAGDTVVFAARSSALQRTWLYSAPVDGSIPPIQLDSPAPSYSSIRLFGITSDGSRVVFVADRASNELFQLFSVPIDRSQAPVRLSAPAPFAVRDFAIGSNGQVVYREEVLGLFGPEPSELHAVPASGGTPSVRLTPGRRVESDYTLSPAGSFVFFRARASGDVTGLYVTRTDGSWDQPMRINGPLPPGRQVVSFQLTPDARQVVYLADERTAGVLELFRRSSAGASIAIDDLPQFADVTSYRIDPRGRRVFYLADRGEDGREELFAAPLDGRSAPERISDDLVDDGDVRTDFAPLAEGGVLFVADQGMDETFELFRGSVAPPSLPAESPVRQASAVR